MCYDADRNAHPIRMTTRRSLLSLALASALPPAFVRHARAADVDRFTLGVASGCPRPASVVLWTRVMGADLPDRLEVRWELSRDEAFSDIATRGVETAERAWAHSVHAQASGLDPSRWYWYRFSALGARSAIGRTRTAPAANASEVLNFAIASCQRFDHGHYAAWRHMADENLDLVLFLGDYIYEYATPRNANWPRTHDGGPATSLQHYRDRYAQYKSDAALQAMHARAPWIVVWDDHEVENDYAGEQSQTLDPLFVPRRAAAYQAYWEHMPFAPASRPARADMRIHDRYDWGLLARIHALDDRQYRSAQACPHTGRGGAREVRLDQCPQLLDESRSLLGMQQERWLAEGWSIEHHWNLLAQQLLMARFGWRDPAHGPAATHWTDAWDGYPASRRRVLASAVQRKVANLVAFGGDAHANYVTDLKLDYDNAQSPVIGTEFCGTSITSANRFADRIAAALPYHPHMRYGRADQRGYVRFSLDAQALHAQLRVVDNVLDPQSGIQTAARFVVEAGKAGAQPA
jgi:alkaline phosphatase D